WEGEKVEEVEVRGNRLEGGLGLPGHRGVLLKCAPDQGKENVRGSDLGNRLGGRQDRQEHWGVPLG
ncbi:hypothetical protein KM043_000139, partial [Ampulex compressa]